MRISKGDIIQIVGYIFIITVVANLAYHQGEYAGMKEICGEKEVYIDHGEVVCYTPFEIKQSLNTDVNGINWGEIDDNNEI